MSDDTEVIIVGYSGHGFVVADTLLASGHRLLGYCDREAKTINPHKLTYFGSEDSVRAKELLTSATFFCGIGDNRIRARVTAALLRNKFSPALAAVDPSCRVSPSATLGRGVLLAPFATVNALAVVGDGAIINTGATVEHECTVEQFAHIAPGAVITGNVRVGKGAFVGACATVLPGIRIGEGAVIGAGAVVLRDVPAYATVYGNPAKEKL
ncbi:sugar O-acyltransferase (sialic acid O-acetyltransferase NeuD family) [Lewinella aquimaris]|uniref:Sugar O-acyltransferase (Sialic acid O-acetyltransferase NeuD family) n=1 Tax=Neolewinella aquimaris TaxID=1835722 RepID=A0A840E925_9BACT|nr:acetyltransferase [Neolewinella aquimaris]MBB4080222.1 sugar O-acyltransferase (sialic acid O-acetyltransferase NeuD family) [Neolewinella aquimaris]